MAEEQLPLATLIENARRAALRPEQALLKMLASRRLSTRTIAQAHEDYQDAANQLAAVIAQIEPKKEDPA